MKIVKSGYTNFKPRRSVKGFFPSSKMKRLITFDSLLELDFIYLLEYDSDVDRYEEQPLTIEYRVDSKSRGYTPDFHVVKRRDNLLVECKPESLINTDENRLKFAAALAWCDERGWQFRVVTDTEIRKGHTLANIKLLTNHSRYPVPPQIKAQVFGLLSNSPARALTLGALAHALAPDHPPSAFAFIYQMAFHHEVFIDVEAAKPISIHSLVQLPFVRNEERVSP